MSKKNAPKQSSKALFKTRKKKLYFFKKKLCLHLLYSK